jgi:hypothetical protein
MTGESWGEWTEGVVSRLSPKVVVPFVVGLVGTIVYSLIEGEFDTAQIVAAVATFLYAALGVAAPPAPAVSQKEVEAYSRHKRSVRK